MTRIDASATFRLDGRTTMVTGATGNMGAVFSRGLASAGSDLLLVARNRERLDRLAQEIRADYGREVAVASCDLSDTSAVDDLVALARDTVDSIVNNAVPPGDQLNAGDIVSTPVELWTEMHQLIAWGPLRLCAGLAPSMMERSRGAIVNVVSSTGFHPTPGYDAYGLAKGSLIVLTRYMAKEWGGAGIRVNGLNPGTIDTVGDAGAAEERARSTGTLNRISLGRLGRVDEVVGTLVYLMSDASSYVSGQVINIDGGRF